MAERRVARARGRTVAGSGRIGRLATPIGICALAAVSRLWALDLAPLRYDDVDVLGRARAVVGGELTATGPLTSWGIPDPPMSVYLALVPAMFPHAPLASAAWFAVLNVVAVVLTYELARRVFGPGVALAAGVLFAVNPWAIYFSRRSWAEIVPLFTVLALGSAYAVVACRRARWAVLFFVALALQVQTRILALIYAPAALLSVTVFPRRWGLRWPSVGVALGVVVSLPYAAWVVVHRAELAARLAEGNRGIALAPTTSAAELVLWTASGYGLLPATSQAAPWLDALGQANRAGVWAAGLLLLAGLAMATWSALRRRDGWERPLLTVLWLVLPVGALMAQSSSVYLHYLVAIFPAMFLVMALPIGALLDGRQAARVVGAGMLAAVCAPQMATTGMLHHVLGAFEVADPPTTSVELRRAAAGIPREAANVLGTGEQYGVETPIRFWQTLADQTRAEAARAGVEEVYVLAGETDPLTAERPAILDYLLRPGLRPRFVASDSLVFPFSGPSVVVVAPDVDPIESMERFGDRSASVPVPSTNRLGRDVAYVTAVPRRDPRGWHILVPNRVPTTFDQATTYLGYRLSGREVRAGEEVAVTTFWRIEPGAPLQLTASVRLVEPDGVRALAPKSPEQPLPPVESGDWLLARREVIIVPARANSGEYRLVVQILGPAGRALRTTADGTDRLSPATVRVSAR